MNVHYTLNNKQAICGNVGPDGSRNNKLTTNPKKVDCGRCLRTLRIIEERQETNDPHEEDKDNLGW